MVGAGSSRGATLESDPRDVHAGADGSSSSTSTFRGDIDGLRAVAIVLIVGYHVGLPMFPGGFIGVDVFFVISGYLISRNLLAETESTGRVALLGFWGRRIRRLVPALALMLVVVLALAVLLLSPLQWQGAAEDARAAALYVSNIVFAGQATDYFAEDIGSSLFLHTWSLGVEEQFYVLWPLLVAAAAAMASRRRSLLRPLLVGGFGLVLVVSLALSLVLTSRGSAHAFFGLPSRAWEFAAAGLVAALPVPRLLANRRIATASALVGLALIVGALVGFGAQTTYPGAWPLIPVGGTVLVLLAGAGDRLRHERASPVPPPSPAVSEPSPNFVSVALAHPPPRALGRVSYSWYLWHWPLILLAVAALDDDDLWVTGGAALVALVVGAITFRLVENPVRFDRRLVRSTPATYVMGALVTVIVLAASVGVVGYTDRELAEQAEASPSMPTVPLTEVRDSKKEFSCLEEPVDRNGERYCVDGDPSSDRTVVLVGDSHARHWKPVFAEVARARGLKLVIRWRSTCPAIPVRTVRIDGTGEDLGCQAFQRETASLVDQLDPVAVVTGSSDDYGLLIIDDRPQIDQTARDILWRDAYRTMVSSLQERSIAVGSIVDIPRLPVDPLDCVAANGVAACAAPAEQAQATGRSYRNGEREVRDELDDVAVLDINPVLCNDVICPVVIGDTYVYTDVDHLYAPFVLTQRPAVEAFFDDLLER